MNLISMTKSVYRVRDDAKTIQILADNFPMGFEDIGWRILEGDHPSKHDIYTRESYETFKKLWEERYNITLPEYKEDGALPYLH